MATATPRAGEAARGAVEPSATAPTVRVVLSRDPTVGAPGAGPGCLGKINDP
jgi:hypothetical protein